ncbi:MAG: SAM-dependent methyltransferase [Planctomycetota bacterium]
MPLDFARTRKLLAAFDFKTLFVEELGWNRHSALLRVSVDSQSFTLNAVAEKRGVVVFVCDPRGGSRIPDDQTRRKIERQVTKSAHEHLIIFVDADKSRQYWLWSRRETGRQPVLRGEWYRRGETGERLAQKIRHLAVALEEEENLTLLDVTGRARKAFDVERVTKKFYDRFKTEHAEFLKFLEGIPDDEMERWYVSVMLNRLMFIYFIQKKGFLGRDADYLKNKLVQSNRELGKDRYYRDFLCPLFFEGFAKQKGERTEKAQKLLGEVPYLNGGIFMPHQIERLHGKAIVIPDKAFEKLFEFFDAYHWHLDERPLKADNEINPDVLGYIFEKYINQKQMGAYYTKEDITGYIGQNTVIPFLFDAAREKCKVAFDGERPVWRLLVEDPDRYIYPAVRHGITWDIHNNKPLDRLLPLPPEIADGLDTAKPNLLERRKPWNKPAPPEYALPTEIWREVVARRKRYEEVKGKLAAGEVRSINDLITYNLDIRRFAQDVIENCEGPELLVAFWKAIEAVTVLDPTCGSGAFLFAALNILDPLYEACLERMRFFLDEWGEGGRKNHPNYHKFFIETLKRVEDRTNRRYFVLKSVIVNNLFGVDIMEEAVEICKLRLFLKLVAQVNPEPAKENMGLEPLPDIDFNIRAGNTLVGFASLDEVKKTQEGTLGFGKGEVARIEEEAEIADRAFRKFREMQTEQGMSPRQFAEAKDELRSRLGKLTDELDRFLAGQYGVDTRKKEAFEKWRKSHQPFHWFAEFYGILKSGGFDVIIGNPPYVEYGKVKKEYAITGYATESCGNLYAFVLERNKQLVRKRGRSGMIVPHSAICTDRMSLVQELFTGTPSVSWISTFCIRPAKLFVGVDQRLCIYVTLHDAVASDLFASRYHRWHEEFRPFLLTQVQYADISTTKFPNSMPKVHISQELALWRKVKQLKSLSDILAPRNGGKVFFHNAPRYWVRAMDFAPYFWNERGGEQISTQVKTLMFPSKTDAAVAVAALNCSLFYWWFLILSDCRHLNMREIENFPLGIDRMSEAVKSRLAELTRDLMADFKRHKERKECQYQATGKVIYDEFYPKHSKPIIDEIDRVLAQHYGFTDEELDFIINYDIKYRMGGGTENDEE